MRLEGDLSAKLRSLAEQSVRTGSPLEQTQVDQLSREFDVEPKEIRSGFMEQLQALDKSTARMEQARQVSQELRQSIGDGVGTLFAGQKAADAGTTPALQGANLATPAEKLGVFSEIAQAVRGITQKLADGALTKPQAAEELSRLPQSTREQTNALWTPEGSEVRSDLHAALEQLAAIAPDVQLNEHSTAEQGVLQTRINEAIFQGDGDGAKSAAEELAARFPDHALAPWARNVAEGTAGVARPDDAASAAGNASSEPPGPALPQWEKGSFRVGHEATLHLDGEKLAVSGYGGDLKKQGFTQDADTGRWQPPLTEDGAIEPGTYELPSYAKLHVGEDNDITLDISRMIDFEYDDALSALPQAGFGATDDKARFTLPMADEG